MPPDPQLVSHLKLLVLRPTEAPADIVSRWQAGIKANAERIKQNRQAVISDETAFQKRIAGVSQKNWPAFVNPDFHSKSGLPAAAIITSRKDNLKYAFPKYNRKLNRVFETVEGIYAKRFKDAVDDATGDFSHGIAKRTLPFTGDRVVQGRGPSVITGLWLTGDPAVEEYLRGGDSILAGGPKRVPKYRLIPAFRAALNQRIIQAGSSIVKANYHEDAMLYQNEGINETVQGYVDPLLNIVAFAPGAESHVDFILDLEELYLDIQVSITP